MNNNTTSQILPAQSPLAHYAPLFTTGVQSIIMAGFLSLAFLTPVTAADFSGSLKGVSITDSASTNKPPIAIINYLKNGNTFAFDASKSTDSDGSIVKFKWDFGDNTSSSEAVVSKNYATVGTFSVTLTVIDDKGGIGITQSIYTLQNVEKVGFQEILQDGGGAVRAGTPVAVKVATLPTHDGQLKSISLGVKGKGVVRPFRLALYTDLNGKPGTLVPGAITTEGSTVANTFEIVELPVEQGTPEIKSGQQYWIVIETTGTYLFYSSKWITPGQIANKSNITSYSWPSWGGTVNQTFNNQMGGCFFTYSY